MRNKDNFMVDMTRGYSKAESVQLCCELCVSESLCVGWTFQDTRCHLKGRNIMNKKQTKSTEGSIISLLDSGSFVYDHKQRSGRFTIPKAIIFHGISCNWNNQHIHDIPRDNNIIYIGRYMVERMPLSALTFTKSELHAVGCWSLMDEIWVPSDWNRNALLQYARLLNTKLPPIYIIPEVVDTTLFLPVHRHVNMNVTHIRQEQNVDVAKDILKYNNVSKIEDTSQNP